MKILLLDDQPNMMKIMASELKGKNDVCCAHWMRDGELVVGGPRDKKEKILFSKLNKIYFGEGEKYIDGLVELLSTSNWVSPNGPVEIEKEIVNNLAKLYIEQEEELYKNNK